MNEQQTIIIFDGPDMCGKTEMAKELSLRTGVPYFKNELEWKYFEGDPDYFRNALTYGDPYFVSYLRQSGASIIMDRWYPSEWVYSIIFNRETNAAVLNNVDKEMSSLNTFIIIPYRNDYSGLVDQFSSVTSEKMSEIEKIYREFVLWTDCRVLLLNVDDENLEREMKEIFTFLELNETNEEYLGRVEE